MNIENEYEIISKLGKEIKTVKRLKDNQLISVGDVIQFGNMKEEAEITSIRISYPLALLVLFGGKPKLVCNYKMVKNLFGENVSEEFASHFSKHDLSLNAIRSVGTHCS